MNTFKYLVLIVLIGTVIVKVKGEGNSTNNNEYYCNKIEELEDRLNAVNNISNNDDYYCNKIAEELKFKLEELEDRLNKVNDLKYLLEPFTGIPIFEGRVELLIHLYGNGRFGNMLVDLDYSLRELEKFTGYYKKYGRDVMIDDKKVSLVEYIKNMRDVMIFMFIITWVVFLILLFCVAMK